MEEREKEGRVEWREGGRECMEEEEDDEQSGGEGGIRRVEEKEEETGEME